MKDINAVCVLNVLFDYDHRSYKNGFVWHDLCEDDLILPAHGNEYVLKGSELFDECDAGTLCILYRIVNFDPLDCDCKL